MLSARALDALLGLFALSALLGSVALGLSGDTVMLGDHALGATCWSRHLLDLSCPFCGMTRSFVALGHGDVAASFGFHPAGPLLMLWLAVTLGLIVRSAAQRSAPVFGHPAFGRSLTAVAAICLVAGTARWLV